LTVIGEGTRYPEAFPLPSIEAECIAQSLVQLFSRVGVARVILSNLIRFNTIRKLFMNIKQKILNVLEYHY
jgi:hypothetical protein